MQYWAIFLGEIIVLFVSSKFVVKSLAALFFRLTKSKHAVVTMLAVLFFPGVVIHEFSHFLMAEVLFVKAHEINLIPSIEGDNVRLGSVQISQTDIFRRMLIGLAPVLGGGALLGLLSWYTLHHISISTVFQSWVSVLLYVILGYSFFVITNTMFSSKKDVEGGVVMLIFIVVIVLLLQFAKVNAIGFLGETMTRPLVLSSLTKLISFLLIPVGINVVCLLLLALANKKV